MHCYSFLRSPAGKKFGRLVVDEIQDTVNPHPERVQVWTKFFDIAVTAPQQRILLTATFPPHLEKAFFSTTICEKNTLVIRATTDRPELGYHVVEANPKASFTRNTTALIAALEKQLRDDECIIVFFQSSDECEQFHAAYACALYHSKLPASGHGSKPSHLHDWDSGEKKVLAATTAASVGIDRLYIKFTVVVQSTYGLLTYGQEVGRGGRRGEHSYAILLQQQNYHRVHRFTGLFDNKDTNCIAAMSAYGGNMATCRRAVLLKTFDGANLCDKRRGRLTCKQIPGANLCDICDPSSQMAQLIRSALDNANQKLKAPALPLPLRTPQPLAGPSVTAAPASHSQDYYFDNDELTPEMLMELDKISDAYKVRYNAWLYERKNIK